MRSSIACLAALGAGLPAVLAVPAPSVTSACATYTPIPSPPASLHCGETGTLKNPAPIAQSSPPKTLSACEKACIASSACLSFGFSAASKTCKLFSKTLNSQGFTQGSNAFVYYNEHCFACKTTPTTTTKSTKTSTSSSSSSSTSTATSSTCTPTVTNLIENGSFETIGATNGPAGQPVAQSWGVSGSSSQGSGNFHLINEVTGYGYSGSKDEEFIGSLPGPSYPGMPILTLSQTISGYMLGSTYTLTFAYEPRSGADICDFFVNFDGYSYNVPVTADSSTYLKYSKTITYKGSSNLLLFSTVCQASAAASELRWKIDLDSVAVTGPTGC